MRINSQILNKGVFPPLVILIIVIFIASAALMTTGYLLKTSNNIAETIGWIVIAGFLFIFIERLYAQYKK